MSDLLNQRANPRRRLRELLSSGQLVPAAGVYDSMSARLVEAAGFPAVYMSGFGVTASLLGRPDIGLLGMSEMAQAARRDHRFGATARDRRRRSAYGNAIT